MEGPAEEAAKNWSQLIIKPSGPGKKCYIAGGETTVEIKGRGKGGRNQHFALVASLEIKYLKNIFLLAAGTDGTDGPTDAAGAIVDGDTYSDALSMNLSPEIYLADDNSYHFFEKVGGHIKTGPTQTNVMDIVITLIDNPA
jgi:glycerate-2-kinase